ncbi:MAG: winged helix-turn-helix domain-containing protein [Methanomassiliicoccales archaeon]|nr:winged helix-turn-helix domain-containing protein [Methanomassiliicoccales archaeon]
MKAYIRVIYSSDGSSPGLVDKVFVNKGFKKVPGTPGYEIDVLNEGELDALVEELHSALKGQEVRYIPTLGAMDGQPNVGYREHLLRLREFDLEPMEMKGLLDEDPAKFKAAVQEKVGAYADSIIAERKEEIAVAEAKIMAERARQQLMDQLREGRTFHELSKAVPMEEEELSQRLLELVEKGVIRAVQKGRNVVYVAL